MVRSGVIRAADGVRLHYLEAGHGRDMLLVPGWSQTAAQWKYQIADFARTHHVLAIDHRGHGESDRPSHGYRIARLAADLHEVIHGLDLRDVTWVAHSMGCALAWSYWDSFGDDRLARLVLFDEPSVLLGQPHWPDGMAAGLGAVYTAESLADAVAVLATARHDAEAVTARLLEPMWSGHADEADRRWVVEQNLLFPREYAARLLFDNVVADWRDVLPQITVPTLVLGGEDSPFPPSAAQTVAAAIPEAKAHIIAERGSHFAFLENPRAFNSAVQAFLGAV